MKGYKVLLFTSNPENDPNRADYNSLLGKYAKNLIVYRFNPFLRPLWKLVRKLFSKTENLKIKGKPDIPEMEDAVEFVDTSVKAGLIGFISQVSFFLGGFLKLLKLVKIYRPAVIYGYEIYGAPLAWFVARICNIPLVTKFQGTIAYPILEKYKTSSWFRIPNHLIGLKTPADLVIMENDGTRGKDVLLKLKFPSKRILFLIDGVDKGFYIPNFNKKQFLKELGLSEDSKIIVVVSKLKRWKRVDRAIMAMSEVVKKIKDVILIVVGDGEERERLERLAKELNLNNHVFFTGAIPHSEVKYYMNAADVFLSLYDNSNLCNPVLEALECGKCIITIDDGSTKDILVNNQNAILIKKEELFEELPKAIAKCLTDDELRQRLEKNARIFAEKYLLSWEKRMELEIGEVEKIL
jgi:glycosyltransferase involved in cell wall biosynthesis